MSYSSSSASIWPLTCVVRLGDAEVEHLLVPGLDRPLRPRRHDPLRVRAGDVGVGVDHLRLEPQPELHAQLADAVDERVQPVGPDLGRHHPVAEARAVVAAGAEPAVVEHEALDADLGRAVGEVEQPVAVVVEVDRLPHVQRDRALGRDRPRPGPQVAVEAAGDLHRARRRTRRRATGSCRSRRGRAGPRRAAAARRRPARTRRSPRARRSGRGCRSRPCAPRGPGPPRTRSPPGPRAGRTRCRRRCGPGGSPAGAARCGTAPRCGTRSWLWRPAKSSSSSASAGTGRARVRASSA